MSTNYPKIDFQNENPNGFIELLRSIQNIIPEKATLLRDESNGVTMNRLASQVSVGLLVFISIIYQFIGRSRVDSKKNISFIIIWIFKRRIKNIS